MRKILATGAIAAVIATAGVATPARAGACAPGTMMETVNPRTFHVDIKPFKKSYSIGEVVPVQVTVSRPAEEDPLGLGVSYERPVSFPAEEVNVGVGISVGRAFLPGYGFTNGKGKATVKLLLARYVPKKTAHVRAFAYKEAFRSPCLTVEEQGYANQPNAFKISR
ncbi:MAG: hypothetical protein M3280_13540 [Actinomycetota bacterium]|nr:hypothetical protein [Actinomycetota bacterium]